MKKNILFSLLFLFTVGACSKHLNQSPDELVEAQIYVNSNNSLVYNVSFNGQEVIRESKLGIIVDNDTLGNNVQLKLKSKETLNEKYKTRGFHNEAHNYCNQYTYEAVSENTSFYIQTRLYCDGFAFRYIIPRTGIHRIKGEQTFFSAPINTKVWFFERQNEWKLKTYAGEWKSTLSDSLHTVSPTGPIQGPILLYQLNNLGYMAITEAALYNYSGMRLLAKEDASLQVNFTEENGFDVCDDITTPWRVIMLANNLNDLVNSDLITNLNPAPDNHLFADQSWIKPGRSVWSWWSHPENYMTPTLEKHFINKAVGLGFEYTTLDEGWERWEHKWAVLGDICQYAKERDIGVFVWKHSDQLDIPTDDYTLMQSFFDSLQHVGVKGVKIDFMNGEQKSRIDFDIRALQLAAERKLMVNFHGCQSPSGEFRTYPNEITREGIRGLELNKMDEPISANHNVALIFTRCILNNNDYTPVGFSLPGNTTWTHQLASGYAFTSPLLTFAENLDMLYKNAEIVKVLPFIKEMPTIWDETKILEGSSIDEIAIMARRKADVWYLVILNGQKEQSINVKLNSFLTEGLWRLESVEDTLENPYEMSVSERDISANQYIGINLSSEGGYLGKFIKME